MSIHSRNSVREGEEEELVLFDRTREPERVSSPITRPSSALESMISRLSEHMQMQTEGQLIQARELNHRLEEIASSQASVIQRLERVECSVGGQTDPDFWSLRPTVTARQDVAPSTSVQALLNEETSVFNQPPISSESRGALRRSVRLQNRPRLNYRDIGRMERTDRWIEVSGEDEREIDSSRNLHSDMMYHLPTGPGQRKRGGLATVVARDDRHTGDEDGIDFEDVQRRRGSTEQQSSVRIDGFEHEEAVYEEPVSVRDSGMPPNPITNPSVTGTGRTIPQAVFNERQNSPRFGIGADRTRSASNERSVSDRLRSEVEIVRDRPVSLETWVRHSPSSQPMLAESMRLRSSYDIQDSTGVPAREEPTLWRVEQHGRDFSYPRRDDRPLRRRELIPDYTSEAAITMTGADRTCYVPATEIMSVPWSSMGFRGTSLADKNLTRTGNGSRVPQSGPPTIMSSRMSAMPPVNRIGDRYPLGPVGEDYRRDLRFVTAVEPVGRHGGWTTYREEWTEPNQGNEWRRTRVAGYPEPYPPLPVTTLPKVSIAVQTTEEETSPEPRSAAVVVGEQLTDRVPRSSSAVPSDKSRNYIKLDPYNGSTPLMPFLRRFEVCSRHNQWTDSDRLDHLLCALKDGASQLIWEAGADEIQSAEDLIERLQNRYGSRDQQALYQVQLSARRQRNGEDLASLFADIQRLLVLAYPGKSIHRDALAVRAYLGALEDRELALKVSEREPSHLQEAYKLSLRLQAYRQAEMDNSRDQGRHRGRVQAVGLRFDETTHDRRIDRLERRLEELTRGDHTRRTSQISAGVQNQKWPSSAAPLRAPPPPAMRPGNGDFRTREQDRNPGHAPCQQCGSIAHRVCTRPYQRGTGGCGFQGTDTRGSRRNGNVPVRSRYVHGLESAYLKAKLNGKEILALLDSGSQTNLLPAKYVRPKDLQPSSQLLVAANGTEITVVGETVLSIIVDGMVFRIQALVTPQLEELILGLSFMTEQDIVWNFKYGWLELLGRRVAVHFRSELGRCRRVVAVKDTVIPPLTEVNVEAYAVLPSLRRSDANWATKATMLETGLVLAGALLPPRAVDLTLRVLNPTEKAIRLRKGIRCDAEEVAVLGNSSAPSEVVRCANVAVESPADVEAVLEPLWRGVADDVPETIQARLHDLLLEYKKAFSLGEWDLGYTDLLLHEIETGSEAPVRQALRRQPLLQLPVIDEQVDTMLRQGLIERSCSEWASNVVIVTKKDGTPRFCIDYRQLNNKTRKDAYPLPLIGECLDTLGGASWFSTFDLRAGYHQLALHPRDRHKTAFITRGGSFQFKVLPFGLCGSPASFSRLMGLVMAGLNFAICLIYLDDIIVFSNDLDTHLQRLKQVLERLAAVNLKLKPSKCHLLQRQVLFLGHIVSHEGIGTDPKKVEAVKSWPTPTKLKEVRAFLGLCSYYRKFVPEFAHIGRPLHALTRKDVRFHWSDECDSAFEQLKTALTEAPILALPVDEGMYVLDTDASGEAIGAVLSQVQQGMERVICYGSRLCSTAEQNYDVTRRELLAIIYFLKLYRPYLLGRRFLLRTDHSALQWLRRTPVPIGQQARWLTTIEEFDFEVQHRAGSAHLNADALSRRPYLVRVMRTSSSELINQELLPDHWSRRVVAEEQSADPDLGWVMKAMSTSNVPPPPEECKSQSSVVKLLIHQWPQLSVSNGVLTRKWLSAEDSSVRWEQLVLPKSRRAELIVMAHAGLTGGHLGYRRTVAQVQRRAYWPGWREDVRLQLARCQPCARYFRGKLTHHGPLQNMVVGEIGEVLALDLTGPHVVSSQGFKYILTMVDHFSRWAEAFPVRNQEAHTVARVVVDQWITRFGCPLQILTDQGPCFESALFKDLCRLLNVTKLRTSSYKPSTNGCLERFHRTLNSMLGKVVSANQRNWPECLQPIMAAYRASVHESTGYTPNKLFLHRELCMPLDLVLEECLERPDGSTSYHEYVREKGAQIAGTFALARECMQRQAETRAKRYDLRVKPKEYPVGGFAWYYYPRKRQGLKDKWLSYWTGPFRVEGRVGPVLYRIRKSPRSQAKLVYVDKLKSYVGPTPEQWGGAPEEEVQVVDSPWEEESDTYGTEVPRPKRKTRGPVRYGFDD